MSRTATVPAPDIASHVLGNGLQVTLSELHTTPLVHAHLAIPFDLRNSTTLAVVDVMTAAWVDTRASARFEQLGGKISVSRRRHYALLSLTCLDVHLEALLQVMAAAVDGCYQEEDVRLARSKCLQQSALVAAQPAALSQRRLWTRVYGVVPPLLEPAPDVLDLAGVDAEDLAVLHAQQVSPTSSRLVLVGALSTQWALGRVRSALGWWTAPEVAPAPGTLPSTRPPGVVGHHADLPSTHVRLAAASFPVAHPDAFTTASVANVILGGNFSSRLNRIVRERDGLAYRVGSTLVDQYDQVLSVVEVDAALEATEPCLRLVADILGDLAEAGPRPSEVDDAVGYILGSYELSVGSQSSLGACLLSYLTTGLSPTMIADLPATLRDLTPADLRPAFELLQPQAFWGAVVGPSADRADETAGRPTSPKGWSS